MAAILWILAVILVIAGIVQLFQGQVVLGIVLIVAGFLVGPGGVSVFASTGLAFAGAWPVRLTGVRERLACDDATAGVVPD
jgi:Family of unknown function (DUF5699)